MCHYKTYISFFFRGGIRSLRNRLIRYMLIINSNKFWARIWNFWLYRNNRNCYVVGSGIVFDFFFLQYNTNKKIKVRIYNQADTPEKIPSKK